MTLQTAYEMVATGIRNGFVLEWSKFGITDEMVQEVNYVTSKYEDMFLSTSTDVYTYAYLFHNCRNITYKLL